MFRTAFAAAAALTLAACAATAQGDAAYNAAADGTRDCFPVRSVNGFDVIDEHHVMVRIGPTERYIMTVDWDTHGLEWDHRVALRADRGTICTGSTTGVRITSRNQDFVVRSIERAPAPPQQG